MKMGGGQGVPSLATRRGQICLLLECGSREVQHAPIESYLPKNMRAAQIRLNGLKKGVTKLDGWMGGVSRRSWGRGECDQNTVYITNLIILKN